MPKQIEIIVGGMAPPLSEQLNVPPETVEVEQACLKAIVMLKVQGLLTQAQADQAGNKLARRLRRRAAKNWE